MVQRVAELTELEKGFRTQCCLSSIWRVASHSVLCQTGDSKKQFYRVYAVLCSLLCPRTNLHSDTRILGKFFRKRLQFRCLMGASCPYLLYAITSVQTVPIIVSTQCVCVFVCVCVHAYEHGCVCSNTCSYIWYMFKCSHVCTNMCLLCECGLWYLCNV